MKKLLTILLSIFLLLGICGCQSDSEEDIVIVYTNDVHAGMTKNISYAGLMSYVNELKVDHKYVTLVDAGDAIQGSSAASVSLGESVAEALQYVDYDLMVLGNHEFDYGTAQLEKVIGLTGKHYINSNIVYTGNSENNFINNLDKYAILTYGKKKVGFVSFDTPETISDSAPVIFEEDGEIVYDFYFNDDPSNFWNNCQKIVDEVKAQGVDYVVALCHLGQDDSSRPYSSIDLVENTNGIDVVIDGHSHLKLSALYAENKDDKQVLITSSGTGLETIGLVTISNNGTITTTYVTNYTNKDADVEAAVSAIEEKYTAKLDEKLFVNDTPLSIWDDAGIRMIRSREMAIGDLSCDAIRYFLDCDIAMVNGGSIRTNLPAGDITYNNFINIYPFGNLLCCIEVTGQELVDYLEYCYQSVQIEYAKDDNAYGENGSFMQVSGLKLTIDTSVKANVEVDENDNFISVNGNRRVSDVMVLENGEYVPIDLNKTYVLGGYDYNLIEGGSGSNVVFADNVVTNSGAIYDYETIAQYVIDVLNCDLSKYATVDDRITIK